MSRVSLGVFAVVVLAAAVVLGWAVQTRRSADRQLANEQHLAAAEGLRMVGAYAKTRSLSVVERGMIFEALLNSAGLDSDTSRQMREAAGSLFNFRQLKPGNKLIVMHTLGGQVSGILYRVDPDRELWIVRRGDQFQANLRTTPSQLRVAAVIGEIDGSLFQGVMDAGERPELAVRLAEYSALTSISTPTRNPATPSGWSLRKRNTPTASPPNTVASWWPSTGMPATLTRRCSSVMRTAVLATTRRTASRCRKPSCDRP